jgi:hypothetical protein
MLIEVNTDNHITGSAELTAEMEATVESALSHFNKQVTRVEVHLGDVNGKKGGEDDIRCVMEARLEGRPPAAVSHQAATLSDAADGAAAKLKAHLESILGRLRDH